MRARFIAPWKDSTEKPVIYHCVSRVVDRRFAFGPEEKEQLRTYLRMYENFSGCRALAYCFMSNHLHLLLEVPPMPEGGLSDAELLKRLGAIYREPEVKAVEKELKEARQAISEGRAAESLATAVHERFTYRMHDLSEFMKGFMQRFTQWFNRSRQRTGGLWEDAFKSVLVEDGVAARTMAAYIDLNPVRAGIVTDPAEYRWSSYGEAMGGGPKGNGAKARAGLVRALGAHKGWAADARHWAGQVSKDYRMLLLGAGMEQVAEAVGADGERVEKVVKMGMKREVAKQELAELERSRDVAMSRVVRYRVRYFTDGAVLGSRNFVDGVFRACRERFGPKRTSGARKLRGAASAAGGVLWSVRDLRKGIGG